MGFAVDSRQVYIGGDPNNLQAADYNSVSFFEQTTEAQVHTESIANNNILFFTVPFVKYSRGEYSGITPQKQWQPTDARSIISATANPECKFTSADYPVFSTVSTDVLSSTVDASIAGVTTFVVDTISGSDSLGNIRVGDIVTGDDIVGSSVFVTNVTPTGGGYSVTVNTQQTLAANSNVSFTPVGIRNFTTNQTFKSSDVIVKCNGLQLVPESNSEILTVPSAVADYTLNAANVRPTGFHTLTLRTAPKSSDEVTVCYYSNANIVQAIQGVNGNISSVSSVASFYDEYNIPSYREIDPENIQLSTSTGLGFIGLENKHISAAVDGANIANPGSVTLGNLMVSRDDITYSVLSMTEDGSDANVWNIVLSQSSQNDFSPVGNSEVYAYNRLVVRTASTSDYFYNNIFDVVTSDGSSSAVSFALPQPTFQAFRDCDCNIAPASEYAGNDFTDQAPAQTVIRVTPTDSTTIEGVRLNDWIRIVDNTGNVLNNELHDTIFSVQLVNVSANYFDVRVDGGTILSANATPTFVANTSTVSVVNHGATEADVNTTFQFYSENNRLTTGVSNVTILTDDTGATLTVGGTYDVDTSNLTTNSFFIVNYPDTPISGTVYDELSGSYRATLANTITSIGITPVLAIDLSANTTVSDAIGTVNKSTVSIPAVDATSNVQILPEMNWLPQDDNALTAVTISPRPSYSSIDVGGVEFSLWEDYAAPTLATLQLTEGTYTRENSTVRAKLEQWMNNIVNSRDTNLFTAVILGGDAYATHTPSHFDQYSLAINQTFAEIAFCSRDEAALFNQVTNKVYAGSLFDRSEDDQDGTRGLINLKNNIELQTRSTSASGPKIESYVDLETASILVTDTSADLIMSFDTDTYDTYAIDYSITEGPGAVNKYNRVGSLMMSGRDDFTDSTNAAVVTDTFSSQWDVVHSDPFIEPKFVATMNGSLIELRMQEQFDANVGSVVHTIGSPLVIRYTVKRWNSQS